MSRQRLEIVPFVGEHLLDLIKIGDAEARRAVLIERNMREGGLAYSALIEGVCVGCGGLYLDYDGKYLAWMDLTPEIVSYKKQLYKSCKEIYRQFRESKGAVKMKALCDASKEKNVAWARRFGLEITPLVVMESK